MSARQAVPRSVEPHDHLVQFYGSDSVSLARSVGRYLWEGLTHGEGVVAIVTPEHAKTFTHELRMLGIDINGAIQSGHFAFRDARKTLHKFMADGRPDAERFQTAVAPLIEAVRVRSEGKRCRGYGEMVGILWEEGQVAAAVELEQLWNSLMEAAGFDLMCGYPIDIFGDGFDGQVIGEILRAHTEVISAASNGDLTAALKRATSEILREPVGTYQFEPRRNRKGHVTVIPAAESAILAIREQASASAPKILARAREHYRVERRFRALVENSADGIALLDAQGAVVYVSPATSKVLGYGSGELSGRNLLGLIHPDNLHSFLETWQESLEKEGSPTPVETRMLHASGNWLWVEGVLSNMSADPDIGAVVFNHRDITQRKAAAQMEEKLREAAKLESLGILAGGIAHDFNNLLTGILGGASLLMEELPGESPLHSIAETIVQASERAAQLTRQMLAYSGRGSFLIEPLELSTEVRQILSLLTASIPKNVQICVDLDETHAMIEADAGQLQQLVMNLVINGAEAIRGEGIVGVRTRVARLEETKPTLTGDLAPGDYVVLRVQDNGAGMDEATRKRIFDPFFTTKFTGRGLGLAAALGIVRAHQGGIEVQSEPGLGSVFTVLFPVWQKSGQPYYPTRTAP
jgi:PAS domain S-box-containing protein